jgi:cytochrome c551
LYDRRVRRVLLIVVALALPLLVVACGGEEDKTTAPEAGDTGAPAATDTGAPAATDTGGGETEPAETTEGGGGEGDPEAGAEVYASAGCGGCHTFEAAGSSGTVGPNLDDADVSFDAAVEQITNGGGGMQAFKDQLSEEEIANVAAFVTSG